MSTPKNRNAYFREYARKHPEKRKALVAAWKARNPDKVAAARERYRDKHSATPRTPRTSAATRVAEAKVKTDRTKAEALEKLRERFAAYRAAKQHSP